jgi:hypothetical protein
MFHVNHLTYQNHQVTKSCCAAAVTFEKETGNVGAVTMIDTDFASDVLSYSEDDLSEDTLNRRMKSGAGNSANMVMGLEWQSVDLHMSLILVVVLLTEDKSACCIFVLPHFPTDEGEQQSYHDRCTQ